MAPTGGTTDDNIAESTGRSVGVRLARRLIGGTSGPTTIEPLRVLGVAGILVAFAAGLTLFLQATGTGPEEAVVVLPDLARVAEEATIEPSEEPRYLAFRATMDSQIYTVDRLDGLTGDLDDRTAATRRSEADSDGVDAGLETDLFPPYPLARQASIAPGLYATRFGIDECSFELRRTDDQGDERVIGQDRVVGGRMLVTVHDVEPDVFDPSSSCGQWSEWSPLVAPLQQAVSGDYWRSDLRRGRWSVSRGCEWEKVVGFRGADLADVVDSGIGPGTVELDEDTLGLRVRRCPDGMSWNGPLDSTGTSIP
jgi:hypothetical protein